MAWSQSPLDTWQAPGGVTQVTPAHGFALQRPVAGSQPNWQLSSVWVNVHELVPESQVPPEYVREACPMQAAGGGVQTFGVPAHWPAASQTSDSVHPSASSHAVPTPLGG